MYNNSLEKISRFFVGLAKFFLKLAVFFVVIYLIGIRLFDFEQAKKHFENVLEKNSEHLDSKIGMALICALENDFNLVDSLKEKYGSNVYIQESIGLEYFSSGKIEDSIEMFKKALRTDKRQTYNLLHLARAYQKLNNNDKVRDYFEKFTNSIDS